jgi:hypothetical protein
MQLSERVCAEETMLAEEKIMLHSLTVDEKV